MAVPMSLAFLTVPELTPPQAVAVAARAGYSHVGLRLLPASPGGTAWPLMNDAPLLRQTIADVKAAGIGVFDLEIIRLNAESDPDSYKAFFDVGAQLGAKAVLVAGDDPDRARMTANYARLCEVALPYGLTMDLEFMPWTTVPDVPAAIDIVTKAHQPNAGILVDALHYDRAHGTTAQLDQLKREWLHYAQLCDGPAEHPATTEEMIRTAREARMFPGEGGIDLLPILRHLPRDLPISLEVPTLELAKTMGAEARALHARKMAEAIMAKAAA